ncbi:hypothetical protein [Mucilaginibacter sp. R-33]|uniref:hypothetical protein n=1 Tax=Mucilaginibacter sp. R-33 TaxID=3416711 RepID=UPI003CE9CF53
MIVDSKVIKTTSAANEIKSAIEYYGTSELKAGIGQIRILDLEIPEAGIAESIAGSAEKIEYDFKYFEGEIKS